MKAFAIRSRCFVLCMSVWFLASAALAQYTDPVVINDLGGPQEFARRRQELAKQLKTCEIAVGALSSQTGRTPVVVGDQVDIVGDVSGTTDTLARIVRVRPRTSVLRRSADDTDPVERIIVANADQLVIVTALANPPTRVRLIDRFLVAAYDAGLDPLLCLTKADLAPPDEVLAMYEPLGFPYVVTSRPFSDEVLADLHTRLAGRESVLVGHSGGGAIITEAGSHSNVAALWRMLMGQFVAAAQARIEREQRAGHVDTLAAGAGGDLARPVDPGPVHHRHVVGDVQRRVEADDQDHGPGRFMCRPGQWRPPTG